LGRSPQVRRYVEVNPQVEVEIARVERVAHLGSLNKGIEVEGEKGEKGEENLRERKTSSSGGSPLGSGAVVDPSGVRGEAGRLRPRAPTLDHPPPSLLAPAPCLAVGHDATVRRGVT
jgi:hypothetical protein